MQTAPPLPTRLRRGVANGLFLLCASGMVVSSTGAQAIRVVVLDSAESRPLPDALVSLLDSAAELLTMRRSDARGAAWLSAPAPGHYAVRVQMIGRPSIISEWLALGNTDSLEVTFRLARAPVVLSPVLVAAQRDSVTPLLPPGINPRAIAGRVIVPAEIAAHSMGARDFVDVVGGIGVAGLTISNWRDGTLERHCIASTRTGMCARVYVNNMRADAISAIDLATPENLDFAVWLRPADAGVLYGTARPNEDGSVLLLFTKDYRRTHTPPPAR